MYEMVRGFVLLYGVGRDDDIINEMIQLCGPIPERWKPFWNPEKYRKPDSGVQPSAHEGLHADVFDLIIDPQKRWSVHRRNFLGPQPNETAAKYVDQFIDLLRSMFVLDPNDRPLASELLQHPWFVGAMQKSPLVRAVGPRRRASYQPNMVGLQSRVGQASGRPLLLPLGEQQTNAMG